MKIFYTILASVIISVLLSACAGLSELTYYLISSPGKHPDSIKEIGCGEYLVPVTKTVVGKVTVERAIKALFDARPNFNPAPGDSGANLTTATAIKDGFLKLNSVEERDDTPKKTYIVSFERNEGVGISGVCDVPRLQEQITETIRKAVGFDSFVIRLDSSPKAWECLGDESGMCDDGSNDGVAVEFE